MFTFNPDLFALPFLLKTGSLLVQDVALGLDLFQHLLQAQQLRVVLVEVLHQLLLLIQVVVNHLSLPEFSLGGLQLMGDVDVPFLQPLALAFHLLLLVLQALQLFLLFTDQIPLLLLHILQLLSEFAYFDLVVGLLLGALLVLAPLVLNVFLELPDELLLALACLQQVLLGLGVLLVALLHLPLQVLPNLSLNILLQHFYLS